MFRVWLQFSNAAAAELDTTDAARADIQNRDGTFGRFVIVLSRVRDAGRRSGGSVGGGAERRRLQDRVLSWHDHRETCGLRQWTGSGQKRLDVQAGWKGNVHGGKRQHQSHHQHRGLERLRLRVHAGRRRQESAEVHRQQGPHHQDVAAEGGRGGLQGRAREGHHGRLVQRAEDGNHGRVCGRRHRDALHGQGTRVLHQGHERWEEEERHCSLVTDGRRESSSSDTIEPGRPVRTGPAHQNRTSPSEQDRPVRTGPARQNRTSLSEQDQPIRSEPDCQCSHTMTTV